MRIRSGLAALAVAAVLSSTVYGCRGRGAKIWRHLDLHDPGGRAAELRRAPRDHLCNDPSRGPVLQRADPGQSRTTRPRPTDLVCDLCTVMPEPTDGGKTYTFKIREGVKFHDGSPLTAADVAASWNEIIFPPKGILSPRQSHYMMVDTVDGARSDDRRLPPEVRDECISAGARRSLFVDLRKEDPRQGSPLVREEHHGLRPVQIRRIPGRPVDQRRARTQITITRGCRISTALSASMPPNRWCNSTRSAATGRRSSSAVYPPAMVDQLKQQLGDKIAVQTSDWNCGSFIEINHQKKPFDDVRVRRALTLAIDRWHTAPAARQDRQRSHRRRHRLPRIAAGRDQGGIAADRRVVARHRKIAGRGAASAEGGGGRRAQLRTAQPQCRPALQIQSPTGSSTSGARSGCTSPSAWCRPVPGSRPSGRATSTSASIGNCQSVVNPLLDVQRYLPPRFTQETTAGSTTSRRSISTIRCCARPTPPSSGP